MTGASSTAVTFWVNGQTKKLSFDNALALEKGTGFRAEWLAQGRLPKKAPQSSSDPLIAGANGVTNSLRPLPVIEWVKGDEMLSIQNDALENCSLLTAPGVKSPRAKFFVVPDDSMSPDILRGEYVALDPDQSPSRGDYVLVKHIRTGELLLRQYRPIDIDEFNAVPLNLSKYDPFNSKQHGLELLAVLVGHWSGRRSERN